MPDSAPTDTSLALPDLPPILAGPIVRRVEPGLACVWVALSEPFTVRLDAWLGSILAASAPAPEFPGEPAPPIRVGKRLYIALATIKLPTGVRFLPEKTYSYNLTLGGVPPHGTKTLADLGLLDQRRVSFTRTIGEETKTFERIVHEPLGYETGHLPTFVLPPREITDLRLLHGSCRRPHVEIPDAMVWMDDLIQASRETPANRPHQLFLTGDQIYADDVGNALAPVITALGTDLLGEERVPLRWPKFDKTRRVLSQPVNDALPMRLRLSAMQRDARFTSVDGENHLVSLGDFAAHYLLVWNAELWPHRLMEFDEYLGHAEEALRDLLARMDPPEEIRKELDEPVQRLRPPPPEHPADKYPEEHEAHARTRTGWTRHLATLTSFRDGLPKVRRVLANVATYMIFDDHEITDDWFLSAVWCDRVLTSPLGRAIFRNGLVSYALFQGWGNDPAALADKKSPHARLRDLVEKLIPTDTTVLDAFEPDKKAAEAIEQVLGLNGDMEAATSTDPGKTPIARWHYAVSGPRHQVYVLDVRMRRTYRSRLSGPGNVSREALLEQIPDTVLPPENEITLVISSLTVLGPPVIDALVGPMLFRSFDLKHAGKGPEDAPVPGMDPDAIEGWPYDPIAFEALLARVERFKKVVFLSGDVHFATSAAMTYFKKGAAVPTRIAQFTASGLKNRFKELIVNFDHALTFMQKVATGSIHPERLGWERKAPDLVVVSDEHKLRPALRNRLLTSPVLLPVHGWPEDARSTESDWSWRMHVVDDARPDADRPPLTRPVPLFPDDPQKDVEANPAGYARVAARHAAHLDRFVFGRRILFSANFGLISFAKKPDPTDTARPDATKLFAIHEIHTRDTQEDARSLAYTLHEVAMDPNSTETPPRIGPPP